MSDIEESNAARGIKFRAWDKAHSVMHSWEVISTRWDDLELRELLFGNQYERLQFTGLLDKNGVEIYEGDVVNHHDTIDGNPVTHKYRVKWSTSYKPGFDLPTQVSDDIEVIGNIWETPELLK